MEPILEFKVTFSNKDYYIYVQIKQESIYITIETEEENEILYWKKNLENQTIKETTSQMGSFKSLKAFSDMLIEGLSKKNNSISIDFCSLNEIRELAGNENQNAQSENNIKKYLVLMNTKYERIVYPIQMDYLGPNGTVDLLKNTIRRIKKSKSNNENIKKLNYNLFLEKEKNERLMKENENLNTKIKLLNEGRQLGAVENDDIYKNYSELQEKFETYKMNTENKIKSLNKTIEELKETQFKESKTNFHKNEIKRNKIQDLQQKINQNSEAFYQESKQYAKIIEERTREIESLQKDIRKYIENERQMKVKIANLEKELEKEKRETNYYRYGNYTPKTSKSYKSNYSGSSYKNSIHNSKRSYSNSNTSYLKKNLIPSKYKYRVYKPVMSNKYSKYSYNRYGNNSNSRSYKNTSSKKSYGSGNSISSKGKSNYRKNYISPYRYNKGASPYRYAVNNKIKKSTSKNNSNKNSLSKKKNSPFRTSKTNYNNKYNNTIGYNNYKSKNEVKKNNYIINKEMNSKYKNKYSNNKASSNNNIKKSGNQMNNEKENEYKSIGERLSKIQNLINQANK